MKLLEKVDYERTYADLFSIFKNARVMLLVALGEFAKKAIEQYQLPWLTIERKREAKRTLQECVVCKNINYKLEYLERWWSFTGNHDGEMLISPDMERVWNASYINR